MRYEEKQSQLFTYNSSFQVKVWFQNRRTKSKRETPEGGEGGPDDRKGEEKDEEGELNIIEYDEEDGDDYHHQNSESHHI